ncbi:MAG: hypothetical protein KF716_09560 [Anaerolineae bacterium]|nr:hypothetical protein [Anaerolineae bacterium]
MEGVGVIVTVGVMEGVNVNVFVWVAVAVGIDIVVTVAGRVGATVGVEACDMVVLGCESHPVVEITKKAKIISEAQWDMYFMLRHPM